MSELFYTNDQNTNYSSLYPKESEFKDKMDFVIKVLGKEKDPLNFYEEGNDILYISLILEGLVRIYQIKALGTQASTTSTGMNMYEFTRYKRLVPKYTTNQLNVLLTKWKMCGTMHLMIGEVVLKNMILEIVRSDELYE